MDKLEVELVLQPDAKFQVGAGDKSFIVNDLGLVGIGTTQPDAKFQLGIGTQSLIVSGVGTLGIGTTNPGGTFTVNNSDMVH